MPVSPWESSQYSADTRGDPFPSVHGDDVTDVIASSIGVGAAMDKWWLVAAAAAGGPCEVNKILPFLVV